MNNRIWNVKNPFQGSYKRVLCVCSAGLLRSPTMAYVLSQEPYNYNTRAAGLDVGFALIPVDDVLLTWADMVVCSTEEQFRRLKEMTDKEIINLNLPDMFNYRDPKLIKMIKDRMEHFK